MKRRVKLKHLTDRQLFFVLKMTKELMNKTDKFEEDKIVLFSLLDEIDRRGLTTRLG